jgi:MoaA/NifB/PqqE/SkfB family radical SAM enzyme
VVNSPIEQVPIQTSDLTRFVHGFAGRGFDILNIHGGEPTVSKALLPVLRAGRDIGISEVHLQTNAILLSDEGRVAQLIEEGVRVFVISLHGHTAELQESLTLTPGSFHKIVDGIRNCVKAGALVRVNIVLCKANLDHLVDIAALADGLGVPWLNVSALHPSKCAQRSFHDLVPHPSVVRERLPGILHRISGESPHLYLQLEGFATCHVPGFESLHIDKHRRDIHMDYHGLYIQDYETFMDSHERTKVPVCRECAFESDCNGVYKPYLLEFEGPLAWPDGAERPRSGGE